MTHTERNDKDKAEMLPHVLFSLRSICEGDAPNQALRVAALRALKAFGGNGAGARYSLSKIVATEAELSELAAMHADAVERGRR
ncbi:hypothetical protein P3T40_003558 [Paraburkholderia sp. EB58]|uniref:hypothetical protein n=1 Tax=Paraburkholderia sp. EB58 TaxID=3035125 RepID=UPI003D209842